MKGDTPPRSPNRLLSTGFAIGLALIAFVAALRAPDGFAHNWPGFLIFGGAAWYFYDRLKGKRAWIGAIYTDKASTGVGRLINDLLAAAMFAVGLVLPFGLRW